MTSRRADCDVLIVGAGSAGLAAAAELARASVAVCVLEARDRIGGRILTRREPDLATPIELGAELVHGRPRATLAWLERAGTALVDVPGTRWTMRRGRLRPAEDQFGEMKRGLAAARRPRKDLPFGEFLAGPARDKLTPAARELAVMLVEGFDAADPRHVSTLATLDEWSGESAADAPTFRPRDGYEALLVALVAALDSSRVDLRMETVVRELRWKRGDVSVDATQQGRPLSLRARRAIVTLPLGVLKQPATAPGAVHFVPSLDAKRAAFAGLAAGPVLKVVLRFRSAFWEELDDGRYHDAGFFHAPDALFPTLWSMLPVRAPLLCAWSAGRKAARLSGRGEAAIVSAALAGVRAVFGKRADARAELKAAYFHDWQADPFARGAYCYVTVGGAGARKKLAQPLRDTLFFAGEASATDGESGTVAGALQSGRSAARQVLETLAVPRRAR